MLSVQARSGPSSHGPVSSWRPLPQGALPKPNVKSPSAEWAAGRYCLSVRAAPQPYDYLDPVTITPDRYGGTYSGGY